MEKRTFPVERRRWTLKKSHLILAIETSTVLLGVALVLGERVLAERRSTAPRIHSKMLLPFCIEVLEESGFSPGDLSALCVSGGPGSFTGLRIGCAVAQGLSLSLGLRVVMAPTWSVLLHQAQDRDSLVIVQGKAKGQTVGAFFAKYPGGFLKSVKGLDMVSETILNELGFYPVIAPGPHSFEGLKKEIDAFCRAKGIARVFVAGDAAKEFSSGFRSKEEDVSKETGSYETIFQPESDQRLFPDPGVLGKIGGRLLSQGYSVESHEALPNYYRGFSRKIDESSKHRRR